MNNIQCLFMYLAIQIYSVMKCLLKSFAHIKIMVFSIYCDILTCFLCLKKFIYLSLTVLDLPNCAGFSLVAEIGGYSVAVVLRVLVVEAGFVLEHGLRGGSPWA